MRRSGEGEKGRCLPWSKEEEGTCDTFFEWNKCLWYFVINLHTWFCLSYFLKTNIKFYCIYQYFMSINSFFNTVSVSRYSRPITVTHDPLLAHSTIFFLIMWFYYNVLYKCSYVHLIRWITSSDNLSDTVMLALLRLI